MPMMPISGEDVEEIDVLMVISPSGGVG